MGAQGGVLIGIWGPREFSELNVGAQRNVVIGMWGPRGDVLIGI